MLQNTIKSLRTRRRSKKGFTLMEMLIVVAIIAILVAIAIPVFSVQLTNARTQVDAANLRSATSMAVIDYLTTEKTGQKVYVALDGGNDTMTVALTGTSTNYYPNKSSDHDGQHIQVTVTDGGEVVASVTGTNPVFHTGWGN
jgi:type IV pilus assembly protein PilA